MDTAGRRLAASGIALALLVVAASEAAGKTRIHTTVSPVRPVAASPVRVILASDERFRRPHGLRMFVVGPWTARSGQATFEVRLRRVGPRRIEGVVRFPYKGRWHMSVPASAASGPIDLLITVRARRD